MVPSNEAGEAAYEKSIKSPKPLEPAVAAERLNDVKRVLDQLGVVFLIIKGLDPIHKNPCPSQRPNSPVRKLISPR